MYKNSSGGSTYEKLRAVSPVYEPHFPYFQGAIWGGGILVKYKFGATWKRVGASSRVTMDPPLKAFIQERRIIYLNDHLPWAVSYQLLHQMIQCERPYSASDIDSNVEVPQHWVILYFISETVTINVSSSLFTNHYLLPILVEESIISFLINSTKQ